MLLKWLHRGIGALIGKGAYVMPFALIGIAVLLFARPKGPVRLRGTCIALMPLLIGSIIHAFSCANEYDLSMSTLSGLLSTGMEGSSGGLLGGGLYILLEWAPVSYTHLHQLVHFAGQVQIAVVVRHERIVKCLRRIRNLADDIRLGRL